MSLYDECIDSMAVLTAIALTAQPDGDITLDLWKQVATNAENWPDQTIETLYIVLGEEVGEVARAILEGKPEAADE